MFLNTGSSFILKRMNVVKQLLAISGLRFAKQVLKQKAELLHSTILQRETLKGLDRSIGNRPLQLIKTVVHVQLRLKVPGLPIA